MGPVVVVRNRVVELGIVQDFTDPDVRERGVLVEDLERLIIQPAEIAMLDIIGHCGFPYPRTSSV
jgi:hypothetical protein